MFFEKKVKFDKEFAKQGLSKLVLRKNIELFEEIKDNEYVVGEGNHSKIQKKLYKMVDSDLKAVDNQYKRYKSIVSKIEKLRKKQRKRRREYFAWFENYVKTLEALEEERLLNKISSETDKTMLNGVLSGPISEADLIFTDELEEYVEELNEICDYEEPEEEEIEDDEETDEDEEGEEEEPQNEEADITSQPQETDEIRELVES